MDVMDFQNTMGMTTPQQKPIKKYNRKNQFLFYGGLIILICAFFVPGQIAGKFVGMSSYEYYMLGAMALIGILLMIAAVKKPKQKVLMQRPVQQTQRPVQRTDAMALPISRPAIQPQIQQRSVIQNRPTAQPALKPAMRPIQQQRPVQNNLTVRPVLKPAIRPQVQQPRPVQQPVQRQQIPAQRPIQAARPAVQTQQRPIQQQVQPRPVFRPQVQQQSPQHDNSWIQQPKKPGLFARLKDKLTKRKTYINQSYGAQSKPASKKELEMMNKIEQSLNKQMYDIDYMKAKERRS